MIFFLNSILIIHIAYYYHCLKIKYIHFVCATPSLICLLDWIIKKQLRSETAVKRHESYINSQIPWLVLDSVSSTERKVTVCFLHNLLQAHFVLHFPYSPCEYMEKHPQSACSVSVIPNRMSLGFNITSDSVQFLDPQSFSKSFALETRPRSDNTAAIFVFWTGWVSQPADKVEVKVWHNIILSHSVILLELDSFFIELLYGPRVEGGKILIVIHTTHSVLSCSHL